LKHRCRRTFGKNWTGCNQENQRSPGKRNEKIKMKNAR